MRVSVEMEISTRAGIERAVGKPCLSDLPNNGAGLTMCSRRAARVWHYGNGGCVLWSAPAVLLVILLTFMVIPISARAQELYFSGRMECFTIGNPPSLAIVETIACPNNSNVVQCNNVQVVGEYFTNVWHTLGTKTFNTLSPGQRARFTIVGGYRGGTRCRVRLVAGDVVLTSHGICDRTPQVRDVIVAAAPVSACGAVTEAHLAAITELNLASKNITALKTGDFDGLTRLEELRLQDNGLTTVPEDLFSGLSSLTELYLWDNPLTTVPEDLFSGLSALIGIRLDENELTTVPEGMFSGLTALQWLQLGGNELTTVPEGLFSGLTALTHLYLAGNRLTTIPEGLFSGLSALTLIYLYDNELTTVPEGLFSGLSALKTLQLNRNAVDPLLLTVSLQKVADGQLKAVAPNGAPFDIVLPLSVTNGSIFGGANTITIPVGSRESETLTVTRTTGTTAAVTSDIGDPLPSLPSGHGGYALVKSADLPLEIFSSGETGTTAAATDFNGDGRTDFVDFFLFADAYGGTDPRFDLDGNGIVDFADFFKFVDAFGS